VRAADACNLNVEAERTDGAGAQVVSRTAVSRISVVKFSLHSNNICTHCGTCKRISPVAAVLSQLASHYTFALSYDCSRSGFVILALSCAGAEHSASHSQ
jgi:ferredoxin